MSHSQLVAISATILMDASPPESSRPTGQLNEIMGDRRQSSLTLPEQAVEAVVVRASVRIRFVSGRDRHKRVLRSGEGWEAAEGGPGQDGSAENARLL
jgi:hypothetical protein